MRPIACSQIRNYSNESKIKGFQWVKLDDLAMKMNTKLLFSIETGKHNHASYLTVPLCMSSVCNISLTAGLRLVYLRPGSEKVQPFANVMHSVRI